MIVDIFGYSLNYEWIGNNIHQNFSQLEPKANTVQCAKPYFL